MKCGAREGEKREQLEEDPPTHPQLLSGARSHKLCSSASDKSVSPILAVVAAAVRQHLCQRQTRLVCQLYFGIFRFFFFFNCLLLCQKFSATQL